MGGSCENFSHVGFSDWNSDDKKAVFHRCICFVLFGGSAKNIPLYLASRPFVMREALGRLAGATGGAIQIGRSDAMQKTFDKLIFLSLDPCQSNWVVKSFAIHHISNQKGELMEKIKHDNELFTYRAVEASALVDARLVRL